MVVGFINRLYVQLVTTLHSSLLHTYIQVFSVCYSPHYSSRDNGSYRWRFFIFRAHVLCPAYNPSARINRKHSSSVVTCVYVAVNNKQRPRSNEYMPQYCQRSFTSETDWIISGRNSWTVAQLASQTGKESPQTRDIPWSSHRSKFQTAAPHTQFVIMIYVGWEDLCNTPAFMKERGRVIAHVIRSLVPTAAAWVRFHRRSCGICGRKSGNGVGFLRVPQSLLPILIPPSVPHSLITL
jgi:hypothetical protein